MVIFRTLEAGGELVIRTLEEDACVERSKSKLLPKLDVAWLVSFLDAGSQTKAVRALRDAMRSPRRRRS